MNRTPIELLLMELLYQTVRTEHSSSRSEQAALKRAGFTLVELNDHGYAQLGMEEL